MPATISANLVAKLTVNYTPDSSGAPAAQNGQSWALGEYDKNWTLSSSTTPNTAGEPLDLTTTIGGAATTYDLTAAPWAVDVNVNKDVSGNKLVGFIAVADSTNSGSVTIEPNASNGYNLFGASDGKLVLPPGMRVAFGFDSVASGLPAVAAGAKNIDVSGTTSDVVNILMVFSSN